MIKIYNGNKYVKKMNGKKFKIWLKRKNGSKWINMVTKQYSIFVLFKHLSSSFLISKQFILYAMNALRNVTTELAKRQTNSLASLIRHFSIGYPPFAMIQLRLWMTFSVVLLTGAILFKFPPLNLNLKSFRFCFFSLYF